MRLVADGCSGQNKNSTVIGMACHWLAVRAPPSVKRIELIFPMTGHSFLPPDRVFGNIEKVLKRKEVIADPSEYHAVFEQYATVRK